MSLVQRMKALESTSDASVVLIHGDADELVVQALRIVDKKRVNVVIVAFNYWSGRCGEGELGKGCHCSNGTNDGGYCVVVLRDIHLANEQSLEQLAEYFNKPIPSTAYSNGCKFPRLNVEERLGQIIPN